MEVVGGGMGKEILLNYDLLDIENGNVKRYDEIFENCFERMWSLCWVSKSMENMFLFLFLDFGEGEGRGMERVRLEGGGFVFLGLLGVEEER